MLPFVPSPSEQDLTCVANKWHQLHHAHPLVIDRGVPGSFPLSSGTTMTYINLCFTSFVSSLVLFPILLLLIC